MGTIDFCKKVDKLFDDYVKKHNVKKFKTFKLKEFFGIILDELPEDTLVYLNRVVALLNNKIIAVTNGECILNTVLISIIGHAIDDWNEREEDLVIVEYNTAQEAMLDCEGRLKNDNAELNYFESNYDVMGLDMFIVKLDAKTLESRSSESGFIFE